MHKEGIQTGPFGSQLHSSDYVETGTPIITVEHLLSNRISHKNTPKVSDFDKERLSKYTLRKGDIVFSRVGSVDRRSLVRDEEIGWLFSGRCLRVRPDKAKIDPTYLSYYLGHSRVKNHLRSIAVGATMPSLNTKLLSGLEVLYPQDIKEQKTISHILGSLDDQIELNKKNIESLENIAKALFKSWFIDFDPVRAKAEGRSTGLPNEISDLFPDSLENSELGQIPKGWEISNLEKITSKFTTGLNPRKNFILGSGDNFYVTIKNIGDLQVLLDDKCDKVDNEAIKKINARSDLQTDDVLFSGIGTIGKVVYVYDEPNNWNISESVFSLRANNKLISAPFLYQLLKSYKLQSYAVALSSGSVQKGIRMSDLKNYELVLSKYGIQKIFHRITYPIIQKISFNLKENNTLEYLLQLLLTKLISGELRIADAEKIAEEVGI